MEFYSQEESRIPVQLGYGHIWARFVAFLFDWILLSVLAALVILLMGLPLVPEIKNYEARLKINFISLVLGWLYYAGFESSPYQATPGKQVMGIFVTDTEGYDITFSRATGRFFGKLLSGLILMLGYLMAAFTERRQALHDKMAKTLVLKHPGR